MIELYYIHAQNCIKIINFQNKLYTHMHTTQQYLRHMRELQHSVQEALHLTWSEQLNLLEVV